MNDASYAIELASLAHPRSKRPPAAEIAILRSTAFLFHEVGFNEVALRRLDRALALAYQEGILEEQTKLGIDRGIILFALRRPVEALACYKRCKSGIEVLGRWSQYGFWQGLAACYRAVNDRTSAIHALDQASSQLPSEASGARANLRWTMGKIEIGCKNFELAKFSLSEAVGLFADAGQPLDRMLVQLELCHTLLALGQIDELQGMAGDFQANVNHLKGNRIARAAWLDFVATVQLGTISLAVIRATEKRIREAKERLTSRKSRSI
jgi:tetratricopeptide (TPR) repeat protein